MSLAEALLIASDSVKNQNFIIHTRTDDQTLNIIINFSPKHSTEPYAAEQA